MSSVSRLFPLAVALLLAPTVVAAQDTSASPDEGATSDASAPPPSEATTSAASSTSAADPMAEAQSLFREALALGDADRWAEALELFRRSLVLVPRPSTRFNVGFALFRLGRLREAIEVLDAYLAETAGETSELRAEATARREQAVASLAELTLAVTPDTTTVRVDGASVEGRGASRVLSLDPGRHIVLGTAPGHTDAQIEVSLRAAEHQQASLTLEALVVDDGGGEGDHDGEAAQPGLEADPVFWVVVGVAALAVGAGVGLGVAFGTQSTPEPYPGSTGIVLRMP